MKLYVVYSDDMRVTVGVYTNQEVAKKVAIVYGFRSQVTEVELDYIFPGVDKDAEHYGINLRDVNHLHKPAV